MILGMFACARVCVAGYAWLCVCVCVLLIKGCVAECVRGATLQAVLNLVKEHLTHFNKGLLTNAGL